MTETPVCSTVKTPTQESIVLQQRQQQVKTCSATYAASRSQAHTMNGCQRVLGMLAHHCLF